MTDAVRAWSTARAEDGERGKGSKFDGLPEDARAWATPDAGAFNVSTSREARAESMARMKAKGYNGAGETLGLQANAWATPAAQDAKNGSLPPSQQVRDTLPGNVAAWDDGTTGCPSEAQTAPSASSPAKPPSRGLNHRFGLWLMGFPVGWLDFAPSATRSSRRAPKCSDAGSSS
jgi:hypothetical protein